MADVTSRQDAEHRLANLVAQWVAVREEKATTVAEYNADIKKLEEAIEKLSAEIQGGGFQAGLPFDPDAPATGAQMERLAAQARAAGITGAERREDGSTVVKMGEDCTLTIPPARPGDTGGAGAVIAGVAAAGLAVEAGKGRKAAPRG